MNLFYLLFLEVLENLGHLCHPKSKYNLHFKSRSGFPPHKTAFP